MNKIEKELLGYVNDTERFSGMDSYDSAEGEDAMSYFDDDDMSYASGNQPHAAHAMSDPYVIQYVNSSTSDVTAILFGFNDYAFATNYGNPEAVTITNLQGGTYTRLLSQTQSKEFKVGKWRFQSATSSQLQQTLTINHVDANGKQYTIPLNLSIMKDAYQFQSDVLDVTKPVTVDGNTFITFTLKALTTFVFSIFPVSVLSAKAELNGGKNFNTATAPRLSGKNVAPVIIQTSQAVQGVSKG
jgi:hypothetical protein